MISRLFATAALALAALQPAPAQTVGAEPLSIILPTENDALFRGGGPAFYQYIIRDFKGVRSTPWQGGQYGFVRNPVEFGPRVVFTRFHEGIDIRPLRRNAAGEPLDEVRAVDNGVVVYASAPGARSGYGKYVVVEHLWHGCPYYTLYSHLGRIDVRAGERVPRGGVLGLLGHSGPGLDRERAHLHFEINLFLSSKFEEWHQRHFPRDPNDHGIFNGINLAGFDPAAFYLRRRNNPQLGVPEFLRSQKPFFTVRVPEPRGGIELLKRYPWLAETPGRPPSGCWDLSFDASGLPLRASHAPEPAPAPVVVAVTPSEIPFRYLTRNLLEGSGRTARLAPAGVRLMDLILQ